AAEDMTEERSISVPGRSIAPQVAAALLSKIPGELTDHQAEIVSTLKKQCPGFAAMRKLVLSFRSILRRGKVGTLKRWLKEAENSGITAITRFVRHLKRDQAAVENAVVYGWSNGPVEGHQPLESCEEANVRKSGIRARMVKILEHAETMGDRPTR